MNEKQNKIKEKVVLFPGLVEKFVAKGMGSLKEKRFTTACSFFEQALEIEPDHPQARFGVALSLIEQNQLDEAKKVTEKMLKENIGTYYDILQVHISLLVQLGQYDEVVSMLEGIIAEEKLPADLAESFYHLLKFSRQMEDDGLEIESDEEVKIAPEELIRQLNFGSTEKQWLAIKMLGKLSTTAFVEAIKQFLVSTEHDPVLKSIVLQILKEKNVVEDIDIHKFGKRITINVSDLEDVFHEKVGKDSLELLALQLENENPSLFEMISQVWWHYLFAIYPVYPEPLNPSLWAAAIHRVGVEVIGLDWDDLEIAKQYDVDIDEMLTCSTEVLKIEKEVYKSYT
jgi:tetratricopeptide (TPR) repeat protein